MLRRIIQTQLPGRTTTLVVGCAFLLLGCANANQIAATAAAPTTMPNALSLTTTAPGVVVEDQLFGGDPALAPATTVAQPVGAEFDVPSAFAVGRPIPLRFSWPAGCRVAVRQRATSSVAGASGASFVVTTTAVPGSTNLTIRIEGYTPTGALYNNVDAATMQRIAAAYASFTLTIDAKGRQVATSGVPQAIGAFMNELANVSESITGAQIPPANLAAMTRSVADIVVLTLWDGLVGSVARLREVPTSGPTKVKMVGIDNAVLTARAEGPRLVGLRIVGAMSTSVLKQAVGNASSPEVANLLATPKVTTRSEIVVDPATLRAGSIFEKSSGTVAGQPFAYERTTTFDWRNSSGCA
jgi:hypothetical protein